MHRTAPTIGTSHTSASTTVKKAIGILDILAANAEAGISLTELAAQIDMPKSSAHRYLVTLQDLGLAERKKGDRFYLGTKIIELAGSFLARSDLRNESREILQELSEQTGETIHLAVPSGTEMVYIVKIESKHALGMSSHIGARLPMHCTALGKAILAFSDIDLVNSVLSQPLMRRTPNTITGDERLRAELISIKSCGYAIDNEENEVGIRCIGAPIFDYSTTPIAAISVSVPRSRLSEDRYPVLGSLVRRASHDISKRAGYSGIFPGEII